MTSTPIRCSGRPVGVRDLKPYGTECGQTYKPRGRHGRTDAELRTAARVAGWRLGQLPDGGITATCPTCSKPDPATVAACRAITGRTTAP